MSASTLAIQLLGKEYKVACPPDEREALQAAAALLNVRLMKAGENGKIGGERLAVLVALNLAHELLAQRESSEVSGDSFPTSQSASAALDSDEHARRIQSIETRIDAVLNNQ